MTIEIEKNVPVVAPWKTPGVRKCPFGQMKKGDSFFITDDGRGLEKLQASLSGSARVYGKRKNTKYVTRRIDGGIRVWRIE